MSTTTIDTPRWPVLRTRIAADVVPMPLLWVLLVAATAIVTAVVAQFATVTISAWEIAAQIARWYSVGLGVYMTAIYLPLYVAHGITRREFLREMPVFVLAAVTALALLMALGYAVETGLYGLLGWSQTLTQAHLFDSPTQYHLVVAEHWLVFLVWLTCGAMAGAGIYRRALLGVLTVPLGLLLIGIAEGVTGPAAIGPVPRLGLPDGDPSLAVAAPVCVTLALLAFAVMWAFGRDMPVRSKSS